MLCGGADVWVDVLWKDGRCHAGEDLTLWHFLYEGDLFDGDREFSGAGELHSDGEPGWDADVGCGRCAGGARGGGTGGSRRKVIL